LASGSDFSLAYDNTNKIATLIPQQGVWANGTYTITLNNSTTNGIKDLAGNALQPTSGPAQFVIQLTSTVASNWQNPANKYDVDLNGSVAARDVLIIINDLNNNSINGVPLGSNGLIPANTPIPHTIADTMLNPPLFFPDVDGN